MTLTDWLTSALLLALSASSTFWCLECHRHRRRIDRLTHLNHALRRVLAAAGVDVTVTEMADGFEVQAIGRASRPSDLRTH